MLGMETIQTKTCKQCQVSKPVTDFPKHPTAKHGVGSSCKECAKAYSKKYRADNYDVVLEKERERGRTELRRAQCKQWEIDNRDKRRGQERARDAANRESVNAKQKKWRDNNPLKAKASALRWREKNRGHLRAKANEYGRVYRATYPLKMAECTRRYRKRISDNGGSYTNSQWSHLKNEYGNKCLSCGKSEPEIKLGPDHIIPVSKGGTSDISNIQPLCRICNSIKSDKIIDYRAGV